MHSRPRWRQPPFVNLREWLMWWVDHGKTTACCQRATPLELADDPRRYDCDTCALRSHTAALWRVNAEAWRIHQTLRGRTVSACDLHSYVLERLTETWSADDVLDLVQRLDVISGFLETTKP